MCEQHLWEVKHSYLAPRSNFTDSNGVVYYDNWLSFRDAMSAFDSDIDYNWCFRWDWYDEYKELILQYLHQRKGHYIIRVVKNMQYSDEPEVREFLEMHWGYIQDLWNPVS